MIYDREGRTLAGTVPMESVYVEPRHIVRRKDSTTKRLATALKLPEKTSDASETIDLSPGFSVALPQKVKPFVSSTREGWAC